MGSEISEEIQKLVDDFDKNIERFLYFDIEYSNGQLIKVYLDELITSTTINIWDKIAVACRRMIICDRELDLERGDQIINDTINIFNKLKFDDQPYEAIRYANTCGLISYRSMKYSKALEYFNQANKISSNFNMDQFSPDITSNLIRTDFELFVRFLPKPDVIIEDYIETCTNHFKKYIEYYKEEIEKFKNGIIDLNKPLPNNKIDKWLLIYGHGMASLYHNLGETYNTASKYAKKLKFDEIDFKEKAKDANEYSLKYGEKIEDIYRQLQSKTALLLLDKNRKEEYEEAILTGRWERGKQYLYQQQIMENLKNPEEVNKVIMKSDFRLDVKKEKDKLSLLYNYDAIKKCVIEKPDGSFKDRDGKELTRFRIAEEKLGIIKEIDKFGYPPLYKRQIIRLIRDDIAFITYDCLMKGNFQKALNFCENYNNRSLIELANSNMNGDLKLSYEQEEKISKLKKKIYTKSISSSKYLFRKDDFKDKDPASFGVKLRDSKDPLSKSLFEQFNPEIQRLIKKDYNHISVSYQKFVDDLNRLLQTKFLYDKESFTNIKLSDEIKKMIGQESKGEDLIRLNRLLLEEAYLGEIKRFEWHCESVLGTNLSTVLSNETAKDFLELIAAYEEILKHPIDPSKTHEMEDKDIFAELIERLRKISDKENTAVLKFMVIEFEQKKDNGMLNIYQPPMVWSFLIDRDGKLDVTKFDLNFVNDIKSAIKNIEKNDSIHDNKELHIAMDKLSKKLKLYEKLKNIKNLFIIPDGELFQLPLHLLGEKGQDLRINNLNVYYSPSLTHLLHENELPNSNKKANYLWMRSSTDLYSKYNKPCLSSPKGELKPEQIEIIECATLDSFIKRNISNNFSHVGFSTHCSFHDNLITAYVSSIMFHDSFLTPYDILLSLDFHGVQTIFLGACSGGSSKYTDENEAIGLVTAFMTKDAKSVIAPLWCISVRRHNEIIKIINESHILNSNYPWNLSYILNKSKPIIYNYFLPFVQYANIEIIEGKVFEEKKNKTVNKIW